MKVLDRAKRVEVRGFWRGRFEEHRSNGMSAEEASEAAFADTAEKYEADPDWAAILNFLIKLATFLLAFA